MRLALEGAICEGALHKWVDLVFGVKAAGKEAEKALNVFYYLSYDSAAGRVKAEPDID